MITVKLVGGLGNQLFGYYFGQSLGVDVRYDVSDQALGLSTQSVSIKELNLKGDFGVFENRISTLFGNKPRLLKRIVRKLGAVLKRTLLQKYTYESNVIGFDSHFPTRHLKLRYIKGYFQSYKYFQKAVDLKPELSKVELKNPSQWFKVMETEIRMANPLVIHIRRGDYLRYSEDYGLLSEDYYLKAIELAERSSNEKSKIWLFSDSFELVQENMPHLMSLSPRVILPPEGISDAEVLVLMSLCKKIVIANSTFSWWAATLNTKNKVVVSPNKWFKGMQDPSNLIPNNWLTQDSDWL